ncbi:exported hypothetical protein [uncultured Desulfobacterium sp.]|uniref:Zinc dependent phospholipase C n=1 Tax=uncultured Desulfobacterium sp. TaxID=201089 RepID=A0A445MYA2_9BACT|nr:exported hypothetical protein [uncultured Desulfobacterium sp.]
MRIFKIYIGFMIMFVCIPITSSAYDFNTVHPAINEYAVNQSDLEDILINRLGFSKGIETVFQKEFDKMTIVQWVQLGGRMEDQPESRGVEHFFDPFETWDDAGLSIIPLSFSSLWWAALPRQDIGTFPGGGSHSWFDARKGFWLGLTSTTKAERDTNFAECFRSIGHVMHLVSDLSVPAHVRDDCHYPDWPFNDPDPYELWTQKEAKNLVYTGPNSTFDALIFDRAVNLEQIPLPISALWDQDRYDGTNPEVTWSDQQVGLAEFSNANFFRADKIMTRRSI